MNANDMADYKLIKVGRIFVKDAKGFIWDECHKIYLVKKERTLKELVANGETIYPMEELQSIFDKSCPLRFINWYEDYSTVVPQFRRNVTFTYQNKKNGGFFSDSNRNVYIYK